MGTFRKFFLGPLMVGVTRDNKNLNAWPCRVICRVLSPNEDIQVADTAVGVSGRELEELSHCPSASFDGGVALICVSPMWNEQRASCRASCTEMMEQQGECCLQRNWEI